MFPNRKSAQHIILMLLLLLSWYESSAQSVDPLTGRAIISLPLGGVSVQDISIPVNLSHHGGALKVDEGPGNAGMGWNVYVGGSIYREVRGLPDELNSATQKGWLYNSNASNVQNFTPSADDNLSVCTDETTDWTTVNSFGSVNDSEPDVYYFNAPGISGKFIYGADGLPKLIPYQDLQITGSAASGFTIKTNTGMVYTFGGFNAIESTTRQAVKSGQYYFNPIPYLNAQYNYYINPVAFNSTWYLLTMQSTATGTTANFSYQQGEQAMNISHVMGIAPSYTNKADTLYHVNDIITPRTLSQVTLMNYTVALNWSNNVLNGITVTESNTGDSKGYSFVYVSCFAPYSNKTSLKPFLMEVKQTKSCIAYPSYKFSYTGVIVNDYSDNVSFPVPWKQGWGKDFFGYNNGDNTDKIIPTVYFYQSESGARRFRVSQITGLTATQTLTGTNREVNATQAAIGTVSRIDLPSGGYTLFTYEANKYFDASTNEEKFGPGLRVASITSFGGEAGYGNAFKMSAAHALTKNYQYYKTDEATTSGKMMYPPLFAFTDGTNIYRTQDNLAPSQELYYSRVKEITPGLGYKIYYFDTPNMYPDVSPTVPTTKVARQSGATCSAGLLQNGIYMFPFAPAQDLDFKRGLLTKVQEYTDAGVLTNEKRVTYTMPQAAASIKGLRLEPITSGGYTTYHYSVYQVPYGQSRILSSEVTKIIGDQSAADSLKTTASYQYNALNQMIQSTQTNADNSVVKNYIRYAGYYGISNPSSTDVQANAIYKLNTGNRYGEVIESYSSLTPIGGTETYTGASLTIFKDYGSGSVFPYQSKHFPQGLSFTPASVVPGPTQSFASDSKYILDNTVEYANGLPVNQTGISLISSGTHYATNSTIPLATFVNCKAENAVYEGFEMATTHGLSRNVNATYAAGRTGNVSLVFDTNTGTVASPSVTKNGNYYRISFWANAAQATTFTVQAKNGATVQASLNLSLTTLNQWTYLEGVLNASLVSSSFTFAVVTNLTGSNTAQIDDFVALPKGARVSFQTQAPLTGITSQTDDRGNSATVGYDPMGRKVTTYDRQRNLVEFREYGLQKQGQISLSAGFDANTTQYVQGQPITFTVDPTCISGVTYAWTFTDIMGGVTTATGSSVTKTFNSFGPYDVKCTASAPSYPTQSATETICVSPSITMTLTMSGNSTIYFCDQSWDRMFTASINWVPAGFTIVYDWSVKDPSDNVIFTTSTSANTLTYTAPRSSYQMNCNLRIVKYPSSCSDCYYAPSSRVPASATAGVTFDSSNTHCQ